MASYDRRLLVPYLRDVCSSEMLCSVLFKEISTCKGEINRLTNQVNQKISEPKKPALHQADNTGSIFMILIFGVLPITIGSMISMIFGSLIPIILSIVIFAIMGLPWIWEIKEENERTERKNQEAEENYYRWCENYKKNIAQLPLTQKQLQDKQQYLYTLNNRLRAAQKLRSDVYSVNIIPSRYRNIHAAYYLYDFFNSARETDLEKVIQTMLLDEIIQRLDRIIAQNEEIMLNQRMQLAMQERQNKMIAEHHREEMKSIARMEKNQQLQLDYQDMIAKNQMVTNFFLEADYLRKYH